MDLPDWCDLHHLPRIAELEARAATFEKASHVAAEALAEAEGDLLRYGAEIDRLQSENEELHNMIDHLTLDARDHK